MAKAMEYGLIVSRPYGDSARYDFLVDANGKLSRVQVKSVSQMNGISYKIGATHGDSTKHAYRPDEVDFMAAWVIPCDAWYIVPIARIFPRKTIRVCPHRPS